MSAEYGLHISEDPSITHYSTGHYVQRLTVSEEGRFLMVESPMLGDYVINGGLGYELMTTPNMYRAGAVSQLCKSREIATIPNTSSMVRESHITDIYEIIENVADRIKVSVEERVAYHLAADGDDQSHMAFSHASELAIQKWGGPQNYHEAMWPRTARLGGTFEVLEKYGINVDRKILVPGIQIPGWINSEQPDVNVDRLQYAVAELLLWFDHDEARPEIREAIRTLCSLDNFDIDEDGNMVFKDEQIARLFAKGYLLLASEHWNDPINRVQLHLLIHATQRAITQRRIAWMSEVDKNETRQPENYLMGIDQDYIDALETGPGMGDDFTFAIRNTLYPVAMQERQRYIDYKLGEYTIFLLDDKARDYPSEYLSPRRVEFGPPSSQVEVTVKPPKRSTTTETQLKLPTLDLEEEGITYRLGALKNRMVDPLVKTARGTKRLSEVDSNYASLLEQQQRVQKMSVVVKLAFAGGFEEAFKRGVRQNDREFARIKKRSPMTDDQQRRVIEMAAERAKQINTKLGTLVIKLA